MSQSRNSFVTRQPGKTIWVTGAITSTIIQLPFWILYYIPKRTRPHPKWTYLQALMTTLARKLLHHSSVVKVKTPLQLAPAAEKERFVGISPSSKEIYRGVLEDPEIKPGATGGTWYPSPYRTGDERVILHFHGGAYVIGDSREAHSGFLGKTLSQETDSKAFLLSYRLASNEGGRFPAALQDAVSAYQYLLDQGIPADHIVLSGDSAGGNLAVALLRYIADNKGVLPSPSAALLWSPWLDITLAGDETALYQNRNFNTDYLPGIFVAWGALAYAAAPADVANPYITAAHHPFRTETPIWIQAGGVEVLYDEIIRFADSMRNTEGNKVDVYVEPYANHDILLVGSVTGFIEEAKRAAKNAKRFLIAEQKI